MNSNIGWNFDALIYDFFTGKADARLYKDVISALGDLRSVNVDELGCGTGNLTVKLSGRCHGGRVRAIDYSPNAVGLARKKMNGRQNVDFFTMDFYTKLPEGYSPDKIVACRSLYNPDLSRSIAVLSDHLGDEGMVVVAHPHDEWFRYVRPRYNGRTRFDIIQIYKSIGRVANCFGVPYALFSAEQFQRAGMQHFNKVTVSTGGYGTHHLVTMSRN